MVEHLIKLKNVTKTFKQGKIDVIALKEVCLEINKGDFLALSGPSGSGKTTMLNLIGALDVPTSGDVIINDINLKDLSNTELSLLRRDKIGFIFQAYNLIPVLTAFENAEFVMALQGVDKDERKEKVYNILEYVGLRGLENRFPDEMSGGQQQRVAIARAIVTEPLIVLADEPTANVDHKTSDALLELMAALNQEKKVTFVFSTHDPMVMDKAHELIKLRDGEIVSE